MDNKLGMDAAIVTTAQANQSVINPKLWKLEPAIVKVLALALVCSRLVFIEAGTLAYIYLPHAWVEAPPGILPDSGGLIYRVLVGLWSHWDGLWYQSIALLGYHDRATATAFFPLYPIMVHLFGSSQLAEVAVSLAALSVSFWLMFQLTRIDLGDQVAWYAVLAFAFFPTSFYTNAGYSEAVFLALALATLYFARTGRYWLSGAVGGLATLDAAYGILLAAPVVWLIWRQIPRFRLRRFIPVALIPLGLLTYMGYLVTLFGDPMVFERAQSNWGRHFEWIPATLWKGAQSAWATAASATSPRVLFEVGPPHLLAMNFYNFVFAIIAIAVMIWAARRLPFYLLLYGSLAMAIPLSYPAVGDPLMSFPRLIIEAFPIFPALGIWLSRIRPPARQAYFLGSVLLGLLFVALFATAHWVA